MKRLCKLMAVVAMIGCSGMSTTTFGQHESAAGCPGCNQDGNCGSGGACGHVGRHAGNNGDCNPRPHCPCPELPPSTDCIGAVGPAGKRYLGPARAGYLAVQDHFSPDRFYTYSSAGLDATRMNRWNGVQAQQYSWHGNYNYWRYRQPTALVVPPTAAFQTEYNWGVAQTRSLPIYHQFSQNGGGGAVGGGEGSGFSNTPYWPSSTSQFGIYPVRSPW